MSSESEKNSIGEKIVVGVAVTVISGVLLAIFAPAVAVAGAAAAGVQAFRS